MRTDAVVSRLIERSPYANVLLFGVLAWYCAWGLPIPRWWATR